MISDARRAMTDIAYGGAVRMKIDIQLYGGHIQCVRTNFIIAVTCRLVDSLTCRLESVRDWSGILCECSLRSEQRYSGKPDGVAGTPKSISNVVM